MLMSALCSICMYRNPKSILLLLGGEQLFGEIGKLGNWEIRKKSNVLFKPRKLCNVLKSDAKVFSRRDSIY